MKILLGVPEYPPYNIGGGGEVFKNLAENYKKLGHDVVVVYGYYPTKSWFENIKEYTDENGIKFYQVPEIPYPKSMPFLKTVMPPNVKAIFKLKSIIQKEKPDIAHLHGYGHLLMDIMSINLSNLKIDFIFTNHGYPSIPYQKKFPIPQIWNLYKLLLGENINKKAKIITCVSGFTKSQYQKYSNKLFVVYNGIDTTYREFSLSDVNNTKKDLNIINKKILLSVGRITEYKGFQDVIDVLDRLSDNYIYIIIGPDQDYKEILEKIINEKKINRVIFLGRIERNIMDMFYQLSDIVIIPSRVESFGLVGLEALKNKKIVISSGVQGLKYLSKSENNYVYKNKEDMLRLIKSNPAYKSEEFTSNFNWIKIAVQYMDYLTK
jgi:glycosyltransferase involved in cell wall biosynthesis